MGTMKRYWTIFKLFFMNAAPENQKIYDPLATRYVKFKIRQYRLKTSEKIVANTTYGPIRGVKRISCWNDPFFSFEKIPFAKPPLGELRFKAPVPPEPWTEIKDCTAEGPLPLQTNLLSRKIEGCEDCLYLNVYTKNLYPSKPLPVMVWIYGGGFESGGTTKDMYSPDYFMQRDIVLITITYRVGPFGFMSFEDPSLDIPGNAGLKDQLLGLQWVKANCAEFGGDPNNITLFGESAGAASTHYMMITEKAKGLFHKAILMSGSVLCPWATVPPREWALRLAKLAGYNGVDNDQKVYEFFKKVKGRRIARAEVKLLTKEEKMDRILFPHGPVIEPYITDHTIISESPRLMMRNAWSKDIPLIIGYTSFEGLILYLESKNDPTLVNELGDCENLVPFDLELERGCTESKELGLRIKQTHFDEKEINMKQLVNFCDMMSYRLFSHPIIRTVQSRLKYSSAPTYLYRFDCDSPKINMVRWIFCGSKIKGACHGDELCYLFLNGICSPVEKDTPEYKDVQTMTGILTKFAETGDPNCKEIEPTVWHPVLVEDKPFKCLNIAEKTEVIPLPESEKLEAWDGMYTPDLLI